MRDITFADRCRAKYIVKKLRNQAHLADVAKLFGVTPANITYCEHMTQRKDSKTGLYREGCYYASIYTIRKILEWAAEVP